MTNQVATPLYNKLAAAFEARNAAERVPLREEAFAAFKAKGFPSVKEEDWRFTSLVPYLDVDFNLTTPVVDENVLQQAIHKAAIEGLDAYKLVVVNGVLNTALSALPAAENLTVKALQPIIGTEEFTAHFPDHTGGNAFTSLNTAFFTEGIYVEVPKNAVVDKPVHIIHLYTTADSAFIQPRQVMVVNRNADVVFVETAAAVHGQQVIFINNVTQVVVKENAQCTHYHIQSNAAGERYVHHTQVTQHRTSRYSNYTFSLPGADLLRNNLEITLDDTATETHLYGLYLVAGTQLTDNHTAIEHKHPACQSTEHYKGVIMQNGKAVFNGKVYVQREAQQTNAYQQNNNLLLSDKAQVYAKPQLEIFADDVKCSHGCTIGQFNPESLFYLQARGIGKESARKLLVEAFMFDVAEKIENEPIKEHVRQLIYQKMSELS
ncbi:Iron-regulated ABC transporter permease protein SufD [Filimonas lacunae]|uniref:Iron-regulated ABC transporter permease protein SufD n=1 Tax=Filimonas lacunae TaxID=477680 RepID=A0A173MIT5_9BACT|nr:Fe-S cluster assembly protein SufD [Filimonas lacunae]BAV07515.1 iron-sulfur cluster assembly protein SufD [Filimonas lacunae]SIT30117.1 Iron-regulated ABC transporter permease protein SufD [Filimonas lacunae]